MNPLDGNINLIELVKKAQFGCQESMHSLAQQAQGGLFAYIYRLTLNYDVTEDLQQEILLEMVKSLKTLKHPERFWAWLYRTALGKVQHYFRDRQYEKVSMSTLDKEKMLQRVSGSYGDGLKNLINKELSQAIVDAMTKLKLRHRNILVLRCCEQLPYSKIAEVMDCSEMAAQVLFFRAKHSLKRQLSKHGFGKGLLLGALGLFGHMTTPADAAPVTVSAASTKVGITATVIGAAETKLGLTILSMLTVAFITVSGVTGFKNSDDGFYKLPKRSEVKSFYYVKQAWDKTGNINTNLSRGRSLSKGAYEQCFYFPDGIDGPMFMMMQRWDPQQQEKLCGWLQDASGNYYYQGYVDGKTIYIYNDNLPVRDFKTRRLPFDTQEFTDFLDEIEGKPEGIQYTRDPKTGLLTGVLDTRFYNAQDFKSSISYNKVDEKSFGSFRYTWPDAPVIDQRDAKHKRGWTYFRITGEINGEQVQGWGQIPFVYDMLAEHPPWMKLKIGNRLRITDCDSGAYLSTPNGNLIAAYPPGSFFRGLARPWMGMNTIDIIRRDAAEKRVRFTTETFNCDGFGYPCEKAEVSLFEQTDGSQIQITYLIHIYQDVVTKIDFSATGDATGGPNGTLGFEYLEDIGYLDDEFTKPPEVKIQKGIRRDSMGMLWLIELAQGTLGQ
jgi:RNA polymerase sigma-70 factor (ECF subfamily)